MRPTGAARECLLLCGMDTRYTVGVDLATEPKKTGVAVIDWSVARFVVRLEVGASNDDVLDLYREFPGTLAIDCPFGWPDQFVDFVGAHRGGDFQRFDHRNDLRLRGADVWVGKHLKKLVADGQTTRSVTPLSVSTDKLGSTALRCAELLHALGPNVDRAGSDRIVEVYPAASLAVWNRNVKEGWVDFTNTAGLTGKGLATTNRHCRDALVAAVTARAIDLGATYAVADSDVTQEAARSEGWIHLPRPGSLNNL